MTNRYVTSPRIPHFTRYRCVGEETKYVVKEGAKGTAPHAKKNKDTTTHVGKQAYKDEPHPYPHSSIDSKHREVQEDGEKETKGMGWPWTMGKQWYAEQVC